MRSLDKLSGESQEMFAEDGVHRLTPSLDGRRIDLRTEYGFVGEVSEAALQEIEELEKRSALVLVTAARFAFR